MKKTMICGLCMMALIFFGVDMTGAALYLESPQSPCDVNMPGLIGEQPGEEPDDGEQPGGEPGDGEKPGGEPGDGEQPGGEPGDGEQPGEEPGGEDPGAGLGQPDGGHPAEPPQQVPVYTIEIDGLVVEAGEIVAYQSVAPNLPDNAIEQGYYPGQLIIHINGPIVIKDGGSLVIGKLSLWDTNILRPIIQGDLTAEGLIQIERGGSLSLSEVDLDLAGQGLFFRQQAGGLVKLTDVELEEGQVEWAPPTVDNTNHSLDDVWLEAGQLLTEEQLPAQWEEAVLYENGEVRTTALDIRWDMEDYDGRTNGTLTLCGSFVDENGEELAALQPLQVQIRWYTPEEIVVTAASWTGKNAATAKLRGPALPAGATEVWGEISTDGGQTWQRWQEWELQEREDGSFLGIFCMTDSTPRHYRIAARSDAGDQHWASKGYFLPEEESEDQGGNRGGSTDPNPPERQPKPVEPVDPPVQQDGNEPPALEEEAGAQEETSLPTGQESGETVEVPAWEEVPMENWGEGPAVEESPVEPEGTKDRSKESATESTAGQAVENRQPVDHQTVPVLVRPAAPETEAEEGGTNDASQSKLEDKPPQNFQWMLVAAGLALCAGAGAAAVHILCKKP